MVRGHLGPRWLQLPVDEFQQCHPRQRGKQSSVRFLEAEGVRAAHRSSQASDHGSGETAVLFWVSRTCIHWSPLVQVKR